MSDALAEMEMAASHDKMGATMFPSGATFYDSPPPLAGAFFSFRHLSAGTAGTLIVLPHKIYGSHVIKEWRASPTPGPRQKFLLTSCSRSMKVVDHTSKSTPNERCRSTQLDHRHLANSPSTSSPGLQQMPSPSLPILFPPPGVDSNSQNS